MDVHCAEECDKFQLLLRFGKESAPQDLLAGIPQQFPASECPGDGSRFGA